MDYGVQAAIDRRLQPYVQSNDLPRCEDLEDAARFKVQALTDLQSLDEELRALQRRRDAVKNGLWAFDCILASIRRLSDDILVEIFCHCIPTTRNARPFVSEAPLLLTLVCKKWRTVAMSAPRLWTTLHVPVFFNFSPRVWPSKTNTIYRKQMNAHVIPTDLPHSVLYEAREVGLNKWLRMSAPLSLSISLYCPSSTGVFDQDVPGANFRRATLDVIARYADRISALEIDAPQKVTNELGQAITQYFDFETLPRLQQLRLSYQQPRAIKKARCGHGRRRTSVLHTGQLPKLFPGAESLRELSLNINTVDTAAAALTHVSPNITTLSVHTAIDHYKAYTVLRRLHRLERCQLTVSDHDRWSSWSLFVSQQSQAHETSLRPVLLPNLHILSINGTLPDIQSLCQALELPSITTLHLHMPHAYDNVSAALGLQLAQNQPGDTSDSGFPYPPESTAHLCTFLMRHTSLRSLSIFTAFIQPTELQSMLSAVPQLERLVLNSTQSARPGAQVHNKAQTVQFDISESHTSMYALNPLLTQQRVLSSSGEDFVTLDTPLLPCLSSFEWHQFHEKIPIDPFVSFINNRLFQSMQPSTSISVTHFHRSDPKARQALTVPLKDIKIRLLCASDVDDVESRIIRQAEAGGLKRGVDFHLDVAKSAPGWATHARLAWSFPQQLPDEFELITLNKVIHEIFGDSCAQIYAQNHANVGRSAQDTKIGGLGPVNMRANGTQALRMPG
ncbi:hypothetical protein BJ165DRAFT_1405902 [Panaeolus papilionaceus]|nr:hypothetical protein BJ165DRAFT_1405902 [Panaeolus papilionaceus]